MTNKPDDAELFRGFERRIRHTRRPAHGLDMYFRALGATDKGVNQDGTVSSFRTRRMANSNPKLSVWPRLRASDNVHQKKTVLTFQH